MFSKMWITESTGEYSEQIKRLKEKIETADCIVIGAGAGQRLFCDYHEC